MKIGVYGNGLDSVIACHELLAQGHHVTHFSGGVKIAGHFAGTITEHGIVDLGMVLLENDTRNTIQKSLLAYSNEFGVNAREYLAECYVFLGETLGTLRPRKMKSRLENTLEIADYFIADNLEVLGTLSDEEISSLEARLVKVLNNENDDFIHPSLKNQRSDQINDDLLVQLEIQYGSALTDKLFGSFIESLLGSKTSSLPVQFHRKLWIPLYYPETIKDVIKGIDNPLPELDFFEFTEGSLASNIHKLVESIASNQKYDINTVKFENLRATDSPADHQVYMTSVADMSKLLESEIIENAANRIASKIVQGPRNRITILHLCIKEMENKTVMLQSPVNNLFRYSITNGVVRDQSCISLEFGAIGEPTVDELLQIVQQVEPTIERVCNGELQIVPFAPRYLDMSLIEWNKLCSDVIGEFPSGICKVLPIHPDGASFNDNLVRGLAGSRGIGF